MKIEIKKPIFVIGCFRSGTTVFCKKLMSHPDLATITQTTKKIPASLLLTRILMFFRSDKKNYDPSDGSKIWNRFRNKDDYFMGREDATLEARKYVDRIIRNHLLLFNKPRFLSKSTSNSLRIGFLNELYPDAFFIHIIRDGRAVANSMRAGRIKHEKKFNGALVPGWREIIDLPMVESCGLHWKKTMECILKSTAKLSKERYMEVKYEDFVVKPKEILTRVGNMCGLKWNNGQLDNIGSDLENRNYKWRDKFTLSEIETLNSILGDLLRKLGYEV